MFVFSCIVILASAKISIPLKVSTPKIYRQIIERLENSSSSKSDLYNLQENCYTGGIYIGTPAKLFNLVIDTGSSFVWVEKKNCSPCSGFPNQYDSTQSSTYTYKNKSLSLSYGDSSKVEGYLSTEKFSIGDSSPLITISYFIAASYNTLPSLGPIDGLVGFAFSNLSLNYPTFVDSLFASNAIQSRVFSIYLNNIGPLNGTSGYGSVPSTLEIGSYNFLKYTGSANPPTITLNVESTGYWTTKDVKAVSFAGTFIEINYPVIFDSGTTVLVIDSLTFAMLMDTLANEGLRCGVDVNGYISCGCSSLSVLPGMSFVVGGSNMSIPAERLWLRNSAVRKCAMLVNTFYFYEGIGWIMGDVFLQGYYVVYDMDKMTITVAESQFANSWASLLLGSGFFMLVS